MTSQAMSSTNYCGSSVQPKNEIDKGHCMMQYKTLGNSKRTLEESRLCNNCNIQNESN